uniref:Uncharacterized protein n=1 Tax=Globodera rostochiensis TaxID=31243 RepID=A0A914GZS9_GLORO
MELATTKSKCEGSECVPLLKYRQALKLNAPIKGGRNRSTTNAVLNNALGRVNKIGRVGGPPAAATSTSATDNFI